MKICEVCHEYGEMRRGPYLRVGRFWDLRVYLDLCKRHALALTQRELQATEPPISRDARCGKYQFGHIHLLEVC